MIAFVLSVRALLPSPILRLIIGSDHDQKMTVQVLHKSLTTQAESVARPAVNSLDGEDHFLQAPKKRATSAATMPAESNLNRAILDELAGRLGNFHESARALADCLQTRDVTRKTDQSVFEAAKRMFHKLLGEASDGLERVTSQSRKGLHIQTTRNAHRCSRSKTANEKTLFSIRDTGWEISQLHCETRIRDEDTTFTRITGTGCI